MRPMHYHYRLWRLAGLWPLASDPPTFRIVARLAHLTSFVLFNAAMLLSLCSARSMDAVIETLLPSTTTCVISLKAELMRRNQLRLRRLFALTARLEAGATEAERRRLRAAGRSARRLLLVMSACCYAAIGWRVVSTVWLQPERQLLWRSWWPWPQWRRDVRAWRWAMAFQVRGGGGVRVLNVTDLV